MTRICLGISIAIAVFGSIGCSNACPAPTSCSLPHPDYCPCLVDDASTPRPDAYVPPVDAAGAGDAGESDAASELDAAGIDAGDSPDAATADANVDAG